eukprot:XP_003967653.1 PREDICTED: eukaryotic translation initiation factor 4 gamma 3-like [Takifugu rubripes]
MAAREMDGQQGPPVIKTFRGILNKLTPEKFESLTRQVDELNINDEETLNTVVELLVDKALFEQSYSSTYAQMCHHLKGLKMIWEPIIHTCVDKLLQDECEDSLECMCKLLSIVGNGLDTEAERPKLNSYYGHICLLLKEKKMSSRIKFMLQDVVALRKVPGKVNQDSSRDCDGERKQRCHLGSSSCRGVIKIPVEHKTPPKQAGYLSEPSYLESIAKEEAQVQDCNEEQVYQALKRLLQRNCINDKIEEWIQNTLNNRQRSSDGFVRALMRAVCQSVIVDCGVPTLRTYELLQRVSLLKKYIKEDEKQLVALNILQQLVVHIDQPDGLLRMFLDVLLDEEVIQDETFFKWKSSTVSVVSVNGAPNYYPNSFSAPEIQPQCVESKFKVYPDVARYKSSDEDNVTQVRTFYTQVLNDEERQRLCENFAGSLKGAQLFIQKRMVENLKAIHPDYASRVQKLLDKYNEEAEKNAHVRVYTRPGASAVAASSKM